MSEVLPIELICAIAATVADQEVYTDRSWVVQLALVGHEVYRAVRLILYADLIVTDENKDKITSIPALKDRLLPYVLRITATEDFTSLDSILQEWRPQAGCYIQVPWNNLKRLFIHLLRENAAEALGQFTGLDLRYLDRVHTLDGAFSYGIHTVVSAHLTHLSGHTLAIWGVPDHSGSASHAAASPQSWATAFLKAFPCLTHLGLVIRYYDDRSDYEDELIVCASLWDYPTQIEAINLVLELRDTLFVFLRAVGENFYNDDELRAAVGDLDRHPRFIFCADERRAWVYEEAEQFVIEDAWCGRNIWSNPPFYDFGLTRLFECLVE